MYSPTTRLLTVLEMLQSHGNLTGPEIATRLEVDVRSIRRYITMLRDMGIPVDSDPGRYGSYYLRPGFRLPPLMFNNSEIMAIILGLMAVQRLGITAAPGVISATAKIERVLPDELRAQVRAVKGVSTLHVAPGNRSAGDAFVARFSLAAYHCRQLFIVYQARANESTERTVDVYGLVYHAGNWYAVGYCHLREGLRIFRLDRVSEAMLQDATFERPADFDALDYLMNSIATMPSTWTIKVLLKTTLQEARYRIATDVGVLEETKDGVLFHTYAEGLAWIARYLVGLGLPFSIISPPELRDALRQLAQNITAIADET